MQQQREASRWITFMLENRLESVERVAKAIAPMNSRWLKWYIINEGNMKFITWGAFAERETPGVCLRSGGPKMLRNAVWVQVNLVAAGVPVRGGANRLTAVVFKTCYINKIWLYQSCWFFFNTMVSCREFLVCVCVSAARVPTDIYLNDIDA